MRQYFRVHHAEFLNHLAIAQSISPRIREATTPAADLGLSKLDACYLSSDDKSGFVVRIDSELVSVFSLVPGRGDHLVKTAIECGALHLDCFDGHLVRLYGRHGFKVTRCVPNWTPGGPVVVYMHRLLGVPVGTEPNLYNPSNGV